MPELAFGYNPGLDGATCAWGARWIITQQGHVDFVPDRQDMIGSPEEKQELLAWLNDTVKNQPNDVLSELLASYQLSTRESKEVVLYEDDDGIVLGNPNSSAGYFYVVARFKDETPEADPEYTHAFVAGGVVLAESRRIDISGEG